MFATFKRHHHVVEVFAHLLVVTGFCLVAVSETGAIDRGFRSQTFVLSEFDSSIPYGSDRSVEPFLSTASATVPTLQLPAGQDSLRYTTEVLHSDFPVTALGARWTGIAAGDEDVTTVTISVHVIDDSGEYTRVLPTLGDDIKGPLPGNLVVTKPVMVSDAREFWFEVELRRAPDGSTPTVDSIDFITVDSRRSWTQRMMSAVKQRRMNTVNIVSREEWGADESLRLREDGTELWPAEYADPVAFVVHHTAGTDGGDDPAATIRAIYFWHTVVMGWGDIGYNYLIDPSGTIYQGRVGGDGTIGAHAYNDVDDVNYNVGTIGISLLGCFEETPGACFTTTTVTEEMNTALVELIASKAAKLKIRLTNETDLHGKTVPRVIGHRDIDYTYCPGSVVHDSLEDIRTRATERYRALVRKPFRGKFQALQVNDAVYMDTTLTALTIQPLHTFTLSFTNTGEKEWTPDTTFIKIYNATGKRTSLATRDWKDIYGRFALNEASVPTGSVGTFTFPLRSPELSGVKTIVTKLFLGKNKIKRAQRTITLPFIRDYEGIPVTNTFPVAMKAHTTSPVNFSFTNTGEIAWDSSVALYVNDKKITPVVSPAQDSTAPDSAAVVLPDATVDVVFDYTAPQSTKQSLRYIPVELRHGKTRIPGTRQMLLMRVDP